MANLRIEVTLNGVTAYRFKLDDPEGPYLDWEDNVCVVEVDGECGDGSEHRLYYRLFGPIGSTLGLKIFCGENLRVDVPIEIFGPGEHVDGEVVFTL